MSWNPALNGDCDGMWLGYYYCVAAGDTLPAPAIETKRPDSTSQGQVSTCTSWYQSDGLETCEEIVGMFGRFSKNEFVDWNPTVGSDCTGLVAGQYFCVGIPETPSTRTSTVPSMTAQPSSMPTQSGTTTDCTQFWLVSE